MAWAPPFDSKGRMHGGAGTLTLGTGLDAHVIPTTEVGIACDPVKIKAKDSGDWDATNKRLYGTSMTTGVETKISVQAYFYFASTPDWVIDLLFEGGVVAVDYKPDGTNSLFSGNYTLGPWNGTFPGDAEEFCTQTFDLECSGKPTRGANITEPA